MAEKKILPGAMPEYGRKIMGDEDPYNLCILRPIYRLPVTAPTVSLTPDNYLKSPTVPVGFQGILLKPGSAPCAE